MVNSWSVWRIPNHLQVTQLMVPPLRIPAEPGDSCDRIKYALNFLGTTGCRMFKQWMPAGAILNNCATAKKSAEGSLDYLASNMDHVFLEWCWIYHLEYICTGEMPVELGEHICALADWCNFSTDEEKEWCVQFWFVHVLSDIDLFKKLLALDLTATTAKMLEVCHSHITIANKLNATVLTGS